ncbi:hypothetical protein DINM_004358 [Dirofilaria immitis]|nr:hypothetical protein [Dirofilaria immitis]
MSSCANLKIFTFETYSHLICQDSSAVASGSTTARVAALPSYAHSRFLITVSTNGVLVRIYDYLLFPKSTYKSLFISTRTTCYEAIVMLLSLNQQPGSPTNFRLYLSETSNDLNMNDTSADLCLMLPNHKKL